jgi:hypothetical protein
MLTNVLAEKLVLRLIVQRSGDVCDRLGKAGVAQRHVRGVTGPRDVYEARFLCELPSQAGRQRIGDLPVEIPGPLIPGDRPVGEHDQQVISLSVGDPVLDLSADPFGMSGLFRGEQNEPSRRIECPSDGRPEPRVGREARLVAEHPQRAQLVPGLGEAVEP